MGNADGVLPGTEFGRRVPVPPSRPFLDTFRANLKETFFPDDPLRQFRNESGPRRVILGLKYFLPILDWAPSYSLSLFKSDLIAGATIASLAIPQGISYAKLANLPPIIGLCEFELRAAVGVRHDGELAGSRCGDGGRGVAFDRVDVGERSLADAGASIVSSLGLHSDLLRWALSSGLGAVEVGLLMLNAYCDLEGGSKG
ncbi:hypothetical protein GW17_00054247 [Ensete ventricosum]|uniref:Uncharacterized protein n=1 Tax=Ensete ventricosum TaxID=4639 RepID=A0A427A5C9_ENSVE|nr:hypothetical protein B296_00014424 [Ensete ventricosum]RWV84067.1 hypothetical protein GW17_00054247 [Ensete ventricosum]RZS09901.1 hypothetical protein BHM03_00041031 [Ensete ventricosum]